MQAVKGSKINHRKFPGIKGKRPDRKAARKEAATERNLSYALLSPQEKIKLPGRGEKELKRLAE